jgi:hypothetical protein
MVPLCRAADERNVTPRKQYVALGLWPRATLLCRGDIPFYGPTQGHHFYDGEIELFFLIQEPLTLLKSDKFLQSNDIFKYRFLIKMN